MKKIIQQAAFVLIVILTAHNTRAQTADNYKIYFSLRESDGQNIKIVSYNGRKLDHYQLKGGKSSRGENQPSVSADGQWIGFNTYHFGGWKAAIAKADGTGIRLVDKSGNYSFNPVFSPDGKTILFAQRENGRMGSRDLYSIGMDGSNKKRLTRGMRNSYSASFSPDGSKIVFVSSRDLHYEIYVMDADGRNPRSISKHENHDSSPSWSPDGKRVAFLSIRDGYLNLYVVNADGSGLKNLTNNTVPFEATVDSVDEMSYMYGSSWSPDGKTIVFTGNKDNKNKLFMIDSNGGNLREVVNTPGDQFNPFWTK